MMARGLLVGVVAWLVAASDADMYDVVETHKVPPSTCESGNHLLANFLQSFLIATTALNQFI